jgi:hypothetical protein
MAPQQSITVIDPPAWERSTATTLSLNLLVTGGQLAANADAQPAEWIVPSERDRVPNPPFGYVVSSFVSTSAASRRWRAASCGPCAITTAWSLSYGPPWAHCLGGYQDRLLGGPMGLPSLRYTAPDGVEHKDYRGEVLG